MPVGFRDLQWLDHNSERAYPITHDSSLKDLTGTLRLPIDFIVSLYLPVHWSLDVDPGKFFLRRVGAYETGYSLLVAYDSVDGPIDVATALISRAAHQKNNVYVLGGVNEFADSRGWVVVGSLDNISLVAAGVYEFDIEGARLEPDVVRPQIRGVKSLQLDNGGELSEELYGHIRLLAGRNTRLTAILAEGEDPIIVWDAIEGAGLQEECVCDDAPADPIRTINGIPPDGAGNFTFLGNDCLEVTAGNNNVTFRDTCSEPCCGCRELEAITARLESLGTVATSLENFVNRLEAQVTTMSLVVLGSRLGDRGCSPAVECE